MELGIAIGIDLGTSNSAAAVYRKGKVESIPIDGRKILPSVISYKEDGQILVGSAAKARLFIDPLNSIASSKRYIGDPKKTYQIHNRTLTPIDAASEILNKIKIEASKYLGEEVKEAVITVPAYFTSEQREATRKAGEQAGLKVLRLLPEPTAAAIAYGLDKERNQTIMVYDLGGGTFDVSILKVEGNSFKVVAVDGDSMLGGDDFDDRIVQHLIDKVKIGGQIKNKAQASLDLQRLKEAAEEAKKELSESDITDILIPDIMGVHIDEELTIESLNQMSQPLLNKTIDKINEVVEEAGLTKRDISRVILVGGSTRMRAVQEIVTQQIKKPFIADNVDEIVAHGAAIMAANLCAPDLDTAPVPIEVENAVPHSLGVGLYFNNVYKVKHLIHRNTPVPAIGATLCYTRFPYQKEVELPAYRTESDVPDSKDKLGELILRVTPQKSPVDMVAIFELDENGILILSSAELSPSNPLIGYYDETGEVDEILLQRMIENRQITLERITIDTNK
ncbi:Hsp70 family protein [Niallia sp. Krafla_26]|uniref:Hsp70 family protein n=1 Tax=Niallia sp. Krafla_26 TaxID=3064703 RepID=UPI003D1630C9